MMKFALSLLALALVGFGVYALTSKRTPDADLDAAQTALHKRLQTARVYPLEAYTNNSLQIRIDHGTQDDYGYLTVKWYRNGSEIAGANLATLEPDATMRGDRISADVNVLGIDALDKPVRTEEVTILNSPPRVITASTSLESEGSDRLGTRIDATDPDGDALRFSYRWYRNDSRIDGESGPTLDIGSFSKDDKFYAEIVVSDGEIETAPYRCDPITLSSNAPRITSSPPASFTPDRRYVYQLQVEGPDASTLSYELVKSPEGMTISNDGRLDWALPEAEVGERTFEVVVRVSDATGGEATQTFSLALSGSGE